MENTMQTYLAAQFRNWARSALRMRDTMKLHTGDKETRQARQALARADAEKARFYWRAMHAAV